jgi:hypothetical protein
MEPDDLLCSRNARLKKVLVGRAQWKIIQPPSPEESEQDSEVSGTLWPRAQRRPNTQEQRREGVFSVAAKLRQARQ